MNEAINQTDIVDLSNLSKSQVATVLASLRLFQRKRDTDIDLLTELFEDAKPISNPEIDDICESINLGRSVQLAGENHQVHLYRYFICSYQISLGDWEFPDRFFFECPENCDPRTEMIERIMTIRGGGDLDDIDGNCIYYAGGEIAVRVDRLQCDEISSSEFGILAKLLNMRGL